MGYRRVTYLVYGIAMDYDDYRKRYDHIESTDEDGHPLDINQEYIDDYDEESSLKVIKDDVSGNYVVIGKVIEEANITDGDVVSFTPVEIIDDEESFVKNGLKDNFGITDEELENEYKTKFYLLTHYS